MSQLIRRVAKKGFTLIELMIVVAIIGILAAIAIPKFADLITKSKESSAKGSLGGIRGAITIYYSDTEGVWPSVGAAAADIFDDLVAAGKYLDKIPAVSIPRQTVSGTNDGHSADSGVVDSAITDAGGWSYYDSTGGVFVNCDEPDTKNSVWFTW